MNVMKYIYRKFGVRDFYLILRLIIQIIIWRLIRNSIQKQESLKNILIIPADPALLVASKGDEAMIQSILEYCKVNYANHEIYFATVGEDAESAAAIMQCHSVRLYEGDGSLARVRNEMLRLKFEVAILMGADGMDGSYDPNFSGHQLIMLDMAARAGADSKITGFSIGEYFHPLVRLVFKEIDYSIKVNIRDVLSFSRFDSYVPNRAQQVADPAFMIGPIYSDKVNDLLDWVYARRSKGKKVIVVNAHPLVLELKERSGLPVFISCFADVLNDLVKRDDVSFLFLSHDYRGTSSDSHVLKPLYEIVKHTDSIDFFYPEVELGAPEVKALVKQVDAVITARMHLMIASLGAGTPVFGINYKGKMPGLLRMFSIDESCISSAHEIVRNKEIVTSRISSFIDRLDDYNLKIAQNLVDILKLSQNNFK